MLLLSLNVLLLILDCAHETSGRCRRSRRASAALSPRGSRKAVPGGLGEAARVSGTRPALGPGLLRNRLGLQPLSVNLYLKGSLGGPPQVPARQPQASTPPPDPFPSHRRAPRVPRDALPAVFFPEALTSQHASQVFSRFRGAHERPLPGTAWVGRRWRWGRGPGRQTLGAGLGWSDPRGTRRVEGCK